MIATARLTLRLRQINILGGKPSFSFSKPEEKPPLFGSFKHCLANTNYASELLSAQISSMLFLGCCRPLKAKACSSLSKRRHSRNKWRMFRENPFSFFSTISLSMIKLYWKKPHNVLLVQLLERMVLECRIIYVLMPCQA